MINRQSTLFSRKPKFRSIILIISSLFVSNMAIAEIPVPRIKPAVTNTSTVLSNQDANNFRQGMRAIQQRKWDTAEKYQRRLNDPTAKRVMLWRMAQRDPDLKFPFETSRTSCKIKWIGPA